MTNLGMKIVGDELEVGFTVSSREEFDVAVARLQTVAATIWTSGAQQSGENSIYRLPPDDKPQSEWTEGETKAVVDRQNLLLQTQIGNGGVSVGLHTPTYAEERKAAAAWREDQGLR